MDTTYYYCKCSICFENDSEMEFINCGDQYCFPCLERYVEYRIREGSWGLLPAELTCPVCGTEMQEEDWIPYISGSTIELWNKFKIKRRETIKNLIITRSCPICNHSQPLLGTNSNFSDFLILADRLMNFLDFNLKFDTWRSIFGLENAVDLIRERDEFEIQDFSDSAHDSFDEFLNLLEKMKLHGWFNPHQKDFIKLLLEFGRIFLKLIIEGVDGNVVDILDENEEEDVDNSRFTLISLQLNFQSIFPFGLCEICGLEFCLPCQNLDWFHLTNNNGLCPPNTRLDGSKQCPRCFISIEKEPEGCNEMLCNYCGMKFCWECGRKWSRDCGIYNCKQATAEVAVKNNDNVPRSEIINGRDPEIGVPNVRMLHNNRS